MRKKILILFCMLIAFTVIGCNNSNKIPAPEDYTLIWHDEFNGNEIDFEKWAFQLGTGTDYGLTQWGNNEEQFYQGTENAFVRDGTLIIEARRENAPQYMEYTSARLYTKPFFSFIYGRIEVRLRLPHQQGLWPAVWLMPADDVYGGWAASGELDLFEANCGNPERYTVAAHFGGAWPTNIHSGATYNFPQGRSITDYNIYALEWSPGLLEWFINDELVYSLDNWYSVDSDGNMHPFPAPFNQNFYLLLNMAVGGNYIGNTLPPDDFESAGMEIDYVRVFQRTQNN
ncbi:MAG: glycoside hydrolase family 16 protein [Clostridiales bacterium]|jgi:beta-glucanase (GH16 family)|nr:glycoside hydrolase family 16 protein [Clostridiales bacterium]